MYRKIAVKFLLIHFFIVWKDRVPVDLLLDHVMPSSELWARCSEAWFAIELRRSVPVQQSNLKSARFAYLNDVSDNVVRTKGDVWNVVSDVRRGIGGKNGVCGCAIPVFVDKEGKNEVD